MYCSKDKESVSDFISRSDPKIKKKYEFLLRFIADETNQLIADGYLVANVYRLLEKEITAFCC